MNDLSYRLDGKRGLVIGGASGMGAAVAQLSVALGAEVAVLDVAEVGYPTAQTLRVDLRQQANVDAVVAELHGEFDIIYACAGVADGTRGIMLINFISQRHVIETLAGAGRLRPGAAVVLISSVAGLPWQRNMAQVLDFLDTPDWAAATAWVAAHEGTDSYSFSKQAMNGYVASRAFSFLKQGVRINAVMPGPTDTPLARANADIWLGFGKQYREQANVQPLTPEQIAGTMTFFACDAAAGVNGVTMLVDYGHVSAGMTGAYDEPAIKAMLGLA